LTAFHYVLLKLFYLETLLHRLVGNLSHLCLQVGLLEFLISHCDALLIEFKVGINKLLEEKVVVIHEGGDPVFSIESGTLRMSLICNFFSQIVDNLIKSAEMAYVLPY
jgi:hypothetical protein